jgi:chaperonin cofactor prefoldin
LYFVPIAAIQAALAEISEEDADHHVYRNFGMVLRFGAEMFILWDRVPQVC